MTEVLGVIRLGVSLVQYIHQVFSDICQKGQCDAGGHGMGLGGDNLDKELLTQYRKISARMDTVEASIASVQSSVYTLHRSLPETIRYELRFDRLEQDINSIWSMYQMFEFYQENRDKVESATLEDFARSVTSHMEGSVMSQLNSLHSLVVPRGPSLSRGILNTLASEVKVRYRNLEPELTILGHRKGYYIPTGALLKILIIVNLNYKTKAVP